MATDTIEITITDDKKLNDLRELYRGIYKEYQNYVKSKRHDKISISDLAGFFKIPIDPDRAKDYRIIKKDFDNLSITIKDSWNSTYTSAHITLELKDDLNGLLIYMNTKSPYYQIDSIYTVESETPISSVATFTVGIYKLIFKKSNITSPNGYLRKVEIQYFETNNAKNNLNCIVYESLSVLVADIKNPANNANPLEKLLDLDFYHLPSIILPNIEQIIADIQSKYKSADLTCNTHNDDNHNTSLENLSQTEKDIIQLITYGYTYRFISKYLEIPYQTIKAIIQDLKNRNYVTTNMIEQGRDQRKKDIDNKIIFLSKREKTIKDIYLAIKEEDDGILFEYVRNRYHELKETGQLNQELSCQPIGRVVKIKKNRHELNEKNQLDSGQICHYTEKRNPAEEVDINVEQEKTIKLIRERFNTAKKRVISNYQKGITKTKDDIDFIKTYKMLVFLDPTECNIENVKLLKLCVEFDPCLLTEENVELAIKSCLKLGYTNYASQLLNTYLNNSSTEDTLLFKSKMQALIEERRREKEENEALPDSTPKKFIY